ncbi:MAG TPA: hypothetical protein VNZ48_04130 [Xanthobacteraceae bacterium]|nr:hypothetical protein [Xanthobacteraceae bacterium]
MPVEKDAIGSIDVKALTALVLEWNKRPADQVDQSGLVLIVVGQQIVRGRKRMQSGNEDGAFLGRTAESLSRNGLHGRQRILDAMLELFDEQLLPLPRASALGDVTGDRGCADDLPAASLSGDTVSEISSKLPSLHRRTVS